MRKAKPPLVNQQRLVYKFECDLCKVGCVHYTSCHLHQRIEEHKNASSSISQHFCDKHSSEPKDLSYNFSNLKKCKSKFDCLLFEMFFIKCTETQAQCTIRHFVQTFLNGSFNQILLLFFFCMLYFILLSFSNISYSC